MGIGLSVSEMFGDVDGSGRFVGSGSGSGSGSHSHTYSRSRSTRRSPSPTPSIDSLDTVSSSEAPATPRSASAVVPLVVAPTLEELERTSRFRVPATCTGCLRAGANWRACARCGGNWCSRECRTGAKHACVRVVGARPAAAAATSAAVTARQALGA